MNYKTTHVIAVEIFNLFGGDVTMIAEIENILVTEFGRRVLPPPPPPVPAVPCHKCGSANTRSVQLNPMIWNCLDCGDFTETVVVKIEDVETVKPFQAAPNLNCEHCHGSSVRKSKMKPCHLICNECGKFTELKG